MTTLTLIGKPDCHLCDVASEIIDAVVAELPDAAAERIEIDRLPPSFAPPVEPASSDAAPTAEGEGEEAPRRRRTRRPRTDVAPAEL